MLCVVCQSNNVSITHVLSFHKVFSHIHWVYSVTIDLLVHGLGPCCASFILKHLGIHCICLCTVWLQLQPVICFDLLNSSLSKVVAQFV